MNKKYYVYRHVSPSNKIYIGITSMKPENRWRKDGSGYKGNNYFWNAIQKYSWDNFKHEILFENLTKEEACQKEVELIAFYKSNEPEFGYNLSSGGECAASGCKHSEEHRRKLSEAWKKREPISEETRKRMSEAQRNMSDERKKKISDTLKGRTLSEETKRKISEAKKGKKRGPYKKSLNQDK